MTTDATLFAVFDETLGLSAFAEEVPAFAHTLIADPELKLIVRRDLAAVRIFSAKIHACMTEMQVRSEVPLQRRAELVGTTCLPVKDLREDLWLATWCAGSETALQHCLEITLASRPSMRIGKMLRKQLARILRRRARIESWLSRHAPAASHDAAVEPHVLLVRLSASQGAAMEREFLLRNIPCTIANGTGEAMFRIVRQRPLMVLLNPAKLADTQALRQELSTEQPELRVVSVTQEASSAGLASNVGEDALRVMSDAAERFARGRTN